MGKARVYEDRFPLKLTVPEGETKEIILKLRAFKEGLKPSDVVTYKYVIQRGWIIPGGTYATKPEGYVIHGKTMGAKENSIYGVIFNPRKVFTKVEKEIVAEVGSTFSITMESNKVNGKSALDRCYALIYADWNKNYSFDDNGELLHFIGKENAQTPEVGHFTRIIKVPENAAIGKTRIRVKYSQVGNAGNNSKVKHSADENVVNGAVYDFVINIIKLSTGIDNVMANSIQNNDIYTISGIKLNTAKAKLPKGVYIIAGKKVVVR